MKLGHRHIHGGRTWSQHKAYFSLRKERLICDFITQVSFKLTIELCNKNTVTLTVVLHFHV